MNHSRSREFSGVGVSERLPLILSNALAKRRFILMATCGSTLIIQRSDLNSTFPYVLKLDPAMAHYSVMLSASINPRRGPMGLRTHNLHREVEYCSIDHTPADAQDAESSYFAIA